MPLAGKTTIARMISDELSLTHIDLDKKIEDTYGDNIYNVFLRLGEKQFRDIENEHLKKINMNDSHVLSLGGGAVNDINTNLISLYANRVWLRCSIAEIIKRERKDKTRRPLLYNTNNLMGILEDLYKVRKSYFSSVSNFRIDTGNISINRITQSIISKINE